MKQQVLLDKLSEFLMVEQGNLNLYRVAAARCTDPKLKEVYERFGRQTAHHRAALVRLIERLEADPNYISPTARGAQIKAEKLMECSLAVNGMSQPEIEANDLENLLVAETRDEADWQVLLRLSQEADEPELCAALKEAVQQVGPEEAEHLKWAKDALRALRTRAVRPGPVPDPQRLQEAVTGPLPPITQLHPAPEEDEDLADAARQPVWRDAPAAEEVEQGKGFA